MSTNSLIGIMDNDSLLNCRAIYCHWNGYPENVGAILNGHYKDLEKVEELLKLGTLVSLSENISSCDTFGEKERINKHNFAVPNGVVEYWATVEWVYLFNPNTLKWHTYKVVGIGEEEKTIEERFIDYAPLIEEAVNNYIMSRPK